MLSLSNPLAADENTFAPSTDEEEPCGDGASCRSVDVLDVLKEAAARSHSDTLRHRHVQRMLRVEEKKRSVRENFDKQQHLQRKATLREKGVSTQNAELLPRDAREATPTPILRDLEKHQEVQKALQEEQLSKKARKAFEDAWLQETEKALHDCVESVQSSLDANTTASMAAYREVLEDKLKNHHRNLGTLGSREALEERRRVRVCFPRSPPKQTSTSGEECV